MQFCAVKQAVLAAETQGSVQVFRKLDSEAFDKAGGVEP